jgi:putative phosphoesterase
MRILLIADIHANWAALQAVLQEPHDVCLMLGDLVDYGPEPGPCVDWARIHATHAVRGNHDHNVAQNVVNANGGGFRYLSNASRKISRERLGESEFRFLGTLPVTKMVTLDQHRFFLVHATPRDPLDETAPAEAEFWQRRLANVEADVVCVGHTHMPYVLEAGKKLVINPGSVGQPRDGDPRAAYAVLEGFNVELKRIEYPIEETVESLMGCAIPEDARDRLVEVLRTGRLGGSG